MAFDGKSILSLDSNSADLLASVQPLVEAGFAVHCLHPRDKAPISENWSEAPVHTWDSLSRSFHRGENLGVRLGEFSKTEGGFVHAVDFDIRDPATAPEARAKLAELLPMDRVFASVVSGSGGASRHFYFLSDRPMRGRRLARSAGFAMVFDHRLGREVKRHDWEIELFGTGKQVVLPGSIHPRGGVYAWERAPILELLDLGCAPMILASRFPAREPEALPAAPGAADLAEVEAALEAIDADDREDWVTVGMALHHETGGSDEGLTLWDDWSRTSAKYRPGEPAKKWRGFGRQRDGAPATVASLFRLARAAGWEPPPVTGDAFERLPEPVTPKPGKVLVTKRGEVVRALQNAIVFLERVLGDRRLRWNQLAGAAEIGVEGAEPRRVGDHHLAALRVEMECAGMHSLGKDLVQDAVRLVAAAASYHPVQEHLEGLPAHDGTARLDTWLTAYLGVADSAYTRAVGRKFLIAMVARAKLPGCKADNMLVLGGAQDIGKSTVCHILADRPAWFLDALPDIGKDGGDPAMKALRGKWLVEVGELVATRKSEQEELKSFIVRQVDEYRLAYDREQTEAPRQCVLIGTTNAEEFLRDATGDRRYWPVWCRGPIRLEELKRDRAQIFAEALAAFKAGEAWHLDQDQAALAREMQAAYAVSDPWDDTLRRALDRALADREITTAEAMREGLGIEPERQNMANQKRVAEALRRLGWERVHTRSGKRWRHEMGLTGR